MSDLDICLLGQFQVKANRQAITNFASDKVRALLAYLVTEVQCPHRREILANLLWPEMTEKSARANLRRGLSSLRQVIGDHQADPAYLLISRQDIQFNPESSASIDVAALNRLFSLDEVNSRNVDEYVEILDIYQGQFLAGFGFQGSFPFDEWVLMTREQLSRRAVSILAEVSSYYELNGDFQKALPFVWRQLELEPWQESSRRRLMRLLVNTGRRDEALQQYHALEKILQSELEIQPALKTRALYETIKTGESVLPPAVTQQISDKPETLPAFLKKGVSTRSQHPYVFVSRQAQLTQLSGWLDTTLEGNSRAAFISGVAGSGKTMLMREFVRQAQDQYPELVSVTGYCNAFTGAGDPYLPFREIIFQLCGDIKAHWKAGAFDRNYTMRLWKTIPEMCETLVKLGPDLIDVIIPGQLLMDQLSIFAEENPPWYQELTELVESKRVSGAGNLQQMNLFSQVAAVLCEVSKSAPLVLILDDLQWADTGTVGILFHLGKSLAGSQIMLVGAYRPEELEVQQNGAQHPIVPLLHEFRRDFGETTIELDETASGDFVREYLDSEPNDLGEAFKQQVEAITHGHALFTTEIMRSLQEDGTLRKDQTGRWIKEKEFSLDELPPKVEGIIGRRISRMSPEQQKILTIASVEGELFTAENVAEVAGVPENQVVNILSNQLDRQHRLVRAEQIIWQGQKSISRYRFRHNLFQKYLYDQLDEIELASLHASIGGAIETLAGEQPDRYAVHLARHFNRAGQTQKAIQYYQMAGARAAQMSGHVEAVGLLEQALALVLSLPPSDERDQQELGLQLQIGLSHQATKGFANPLVGQAYERARELCLTVGMSEAYTTTLQLLMSYYSNIAEFDIAFEIMKMLEELKVEGNTSNALQIEWGYGYLEATLGLAEIALGRFEKALEYYSFDEHQNIAERVGLEPGIFNNSWAAHQSAMLGFPEKAMAYLDTALEISSHYESKQFQTDAYWFSTMVYMDLQYYDLAEDYNVKFLSLAQENHFLLMESQGLFYQGKINSVTGNHQEAIELIQKSYEIFKMIGTVTSQTTFMRGLTEAYNRAGEVEEGLEVISQAETVFEDTGEARYRADLYRIKGELLLQKGDQSDAEKAFFSAIAVAREQGTRLFELEATKSLARLWHSQGKTAAAHKELQTIYDWFTEGFSTPMLREAAALLEKLESTPLVQ